MTPTACLYDKQFTIYRQKRYRPIRREVAKITPMKDKGFEPSQMTLSVSLYDKPFRNYSQKKYRPIRRGGGAKLHQIRSRALNQVK